MRSMRELQMLLAWMDSLYNIKQKKETTPTVPLFSTTASYRSRLMPKILDVSERIKMDVCKRRNINFHQNLQQRSPVPCTRSNISKEAPPDSLLNTAGAAINHRSFLKYGKRLFCSWDFRELSGQRLIYRSGY
ncbi:hypothetical protein Trydic_g4017 [Trypoxylus dichotomus]